MPRLRFFSILLLFIWPIAAVFSKTITVTTTADTNHPCTDNDCCLRAAIAAANDEANNPGKDTITFAAGLTGTINLSFALPALTSDITIAGPGPDQLTVNRSSGSFRIFTIGGQTSSGTYQVSISGLTLTNGHAPAQETFQSGGGAIENNNSSLILSNCVLRSNIAELNGGAIMQSGGSLTVTDCTFDSNSTVTSLSQAFNGGGAIWAEAANVAISRSTFVGNSTTSSDAGHNGGGAILNERCNITIANCTFSANSATAGAGGSGGAIYNTTLGQGSANLQVISSTFSENAAPTGGGIANEGANGGNPAASIANSIFFSSAGTPGANLYNTGDGASISSQGYNISSDNASGAFTATGDQVDTNPELGPLQNNGGLVATMALQPSSPAIDAGRAFNLSTDARGIQRPIDNASIANAQDGDGSDIGAYEADARQSGGSVRVTTLDDHDDGACTVLDCSLREALNAANAGTVGNVIGLYYLSGSISLRAALGSLAIQRPIQLSGPGPRQLTISGGGAVPVFVVSTGSQSFHASIAGITIADGLATTSVAGGSAAGGGVYVASGSAIDIQECAFVNNRAIGADNTETVHGAGGNGNGGALANSGSLTVGYSTFTNNSVQGGAGGPGSSAFGANPNGGPGGGGQGGAIFNDTGATLTIYESTFSGNKASGGNGGNGNPGGGSGGSSTCAIFNSGTLSLTSSTVTASLGTGGSGGKGNSTINNGSTGIVAAVNASSGTTTVADTIIARNNGTSSQNADVAGTFSSSGFNLIGNGGSSTGFTGTDDQVGTSSVPINPQLGPLQNNGGYTDTCALLAGSPAIDKGNGFGSHADQRGAARPLDDASVANGPHSDASDIGAYETGGTAPAPPTVAIQPATNITTTSATLNGTVNPNGTDTTYFFISDATMDYNHDAGNGAQPEAVQLDVTGLTPATTYHYTLYSSNSGGYVQSSEQTFTTAALPVPSPTPTASPSATPTPTPPSHPLNISTRMEVLTDDNVLIAGFIVSGPTGSSKKVMIRGLGPSLANQGVATPLSDPLLELHQPDGSVITNDNWQDASNSSDIPNGFQPSDPRESVIIASLPVGSGGYSNFTAILRGAHGETGIGLAEAYDLDQAAPNQFANISTRGFVDTADNVMIGGFILGGSNQPAHILLRAIGPSLANSGVSNALADPTLELHNGDGTKIATNDNWKVDDQSGQSQEIAINSTGVPPSDDAESALLLDLGPGNYTAIVAGKNGTSGVALVEVYAIP